MIFLGILLYSKKKVTNQAVFFLSNFISTNRMICITEQRLGLVISSLDFGLFILCPDCGSSCCSVVHIIRFVEIKFERKNTAW